VTSTATVPVAKLGTFQHLLDSLVGKYHHYEQLDIVVTWRSQPVAEDGQMLFSVRVRELGYHKYIDDAPWEFPATNLSADQAKQMFVQLWVEQVLWRSYQRVHGRNSVLFRLESDGLPFDRWVLHADVAGTRAEAERHAGFYAESALRSAVVAEERRLNRWG